MPFQACSPPGDRAHVPLEARQSHHQQTRDHGDKGHTVQKKTGGNTDCANQQTGN